MPAELSAAGCWPAQVAPGVVLRRARVEDAVALAVAYGRNREHLAPWDPVRPESFFTADGQADRLADRVRGDEAGASATGLLVAGDDVIGIVNLNDVVRGAFGNAHLGYWVDARWTGRGLATAAVGSACAEAVVLGLHRLQAGTLLHNGASQAVLRGCGFAEIGVAPSYLYIAGRWRDHLLFQRILSDAPPRS